MALSQGEEEPEPDIFMAGDSVDVRDLTVHLVIYCQKSKRKGRHRLVNKSLFESKSSSKYLNPLVLYALNRTTSNFHHMYIIKR